MSKQDNGFKTFLITLVISLGVFSGLYYFLNNSIAEEPEVRGTSTNAMEQEESVFADLASAKADVSARAVLAGTTTSGTGPATGTTPSTLVKTTSKGGVPETTTPVPATGFSGPTIGLILGVSVLALGMYLILSYETTNKRFEDSTLNRFK